MMLSCCIMIMEQALESVFVLPHAVSIQRDGNVCEVRISDCLKSVISLQISTHVYVTGLLFQRADSVPLKGAAFY